MKLITVVLGTVLITQSGLFVTCQDSSSEEDNFAELLKNYKACSNGYCIPANQCLNGAINRHGESIVDIRMNDYDDMLELDLEQQECAVMTTCCAVSDGLRTGPAELDQIGTTTTAEPIAVAPPSCGTNHPNGYVYKVKNESLAQFGEFPWMVALLQRRPILDKETVEFFCGGSLIHPRVVLTAAHCVDKLTDVREKLWARLGEWETVTDNEPIIHQQCGIQKIIIHENYVPNKFHNDLALLVLDEPAELNVHINTICLPTPQQNFDDQRCLVSGWGKEEFAGVGKFAEILKRVELPVVPRNRCKQQLRTTKLGLFFQLHKSFICAGGEAGVDTCKGDGGSPLACQHDGRYVQAGIVAWGIGCGEVNVPAAYVKVSNFVGWIQEKLREENFQLVDR